ncbi:hypothetical protein SSX86_021542 [Deinandra increscens subsp. villosa]|uniref:Uncharacterized protein n=1 Tax=Deinandra increscens subsp. villosa TaxID=3103831 RepID=A0AAP0CPY6_9ASTR
MATVVIIIILMIYVAVVARGCSTTFSTCSDSDENIIIDPMIIRQVVLGGGLPELEDVVLQVIGQTRHALTFARFAHRFGKKYESGDEMKQRYSTFVQSLETIKSHNKNKAGLSYTLGVNEFADMTWEEFRKNKLGAAQNCSATKKGNHKLTDDDVIPLTQDWRKVGIVSPVKSQGSCGSCWTFSATGALEAAYAQANNGESVSLSEQQLVDCAGDFNNSGCKGGLPSHAYEYIIYNGGLDSEEAYPYTGKDDGPCKYLPDKAAVQVVDVVNITQNVNHAVVAVGYGVENGIPYWLIKNSWGAAWGINGYFKMEMGKNMCGIATCASYPVVT